VTERLAPPDPHPGLADRVAARLFPGLYPVPEAERQAEAEAEP
jgi:hypothetical protein